MLDMQFTIRATERLAPEAIPPTIRAFLHEAGALVESAVRQRTPQGVGGSASGARASIFAEQRESPGLFTEVIGSNLPYIEPLELGTRPHFPPPAALVPWVERFIALEPGETADGVAWAIARAIARRGTPAHRMFELGLADARPRIEALAEAMGLQLSTSLQRPQAGGTS